MNELEQAHEQPLRKQPYHKPEFRTYGEVSQLTGSDSMATSGTDAFTGWGDPSTSGVS